VILHSVAVEVITSGEGDTNARGEIAMLFA
jgi:hypothetical protein